MKKIIAMLVFATLLLFGAAACDIIALISNSPETETPTPPPPVRQSPTPSPEPSPLPADEDEESGTAVPADWIDLGMISIPPTLSFEEVGLHGEFIITGDIFTTEEDIWGDTWMYVGPLMGDFEPLAEGSGNFEFNDGHIGIFTKTFDLDTLGWIRQDGMLVTLRHGGAISMFTDNEELILQIVRTLR